MTRERSGRPGLPPGRRQAQGPSPSRVKFAFGLWRRRPISNSSQAVALATGPIGAGLWRVALVVAPQLAALLVLVVTEIDTISRAAFLLSWIALNLFLIVLTRRPAISGGARACDADGADPALAPEVRRGADDGELRRRDDDRSRVGRLPVHDLPEPVASRSASRCWSLLPLGYALWRFDPFRIRRLAAAAGSALAMAALIALSLIWPLRSVGRLLQQRLSVEVRAFRRQLGCRLRALRIP